MAEYMETLLAQTPLEGKVKGLDIKREFPLFPLEVSKGQSSSRRGTFDEQTPGELDNSSVLNANEPQVILASPKMEIIPREFVMVNRSAPDPSQPIFIRPQATQGTFNPEYTRYLRLLTQLDSQTKTWESSQKEPLVEIPIKRTKQYFAIIQEMEEYSEKRAAKALDGVDGRTMTEKEEGIKLFEQFFGGLRSLGGREKFQGTPPWEKEVSEEERRKLIEEVKKLAKQRRVRPSQIRSSMMQIATVTKTATGELTPAEGFRAANSMDPTLRPESVEVPKERVIWRFEDVSWVKQRTTRPRKQSYAGTLDRRVQLESGVERYGPFGIGGGVEGVGGVKHVIERGIDGRLRHQRPGREKKRARREIIV